MTTPRPARLARFAWQEAICRRVPHGVIHWRYVMRHPPGPLARQRSIWLASLPDLPRPAWLALEASLWLRWQLWCGPRSVWRAVRRIGPSVRDEEDLGLARQAWRTWTLSAAYCVPAREAYRYRLYRSADRARAGDLVYDHTAAAFHASRNSGSAEAKASLQLLADKERQTAALAGLGVPMAPILAVVRRGTGEGLETYLPRDDECFCKPRHGSRGQGAFAARWENGSLVIETLDGLRLRAEEATAYWARLLHDDDMLVQPLLRTHPDLADQATDDDVVTLRYISERGLGLARDETDVGCYCASVELPAGRSGDARRLAYVILEVEPVSGVINAFPPSWLSGEAARRHQAVQARLGRRRVPGWDQVRHGSHVAHAQFTWIHAIAWDWALTPDGPLLLEGNAGWGVATPQMLKGGLLAAQAPRIP